MFLNLNKLILTEPVTAVVQQSDTEFTIKSGDSFYELVLQSSGVTALQLFEFLTEPLKISFSVGINTEYKDLEEKFKSYYLVERYSGDGGTLYIRESTALQSVEFKIKPRQRHPFGPDWSVLQFSGNCYNDVQTRHVSVKEIETDTELFLKEIRAIFEIKENYDPSMIIKHNTQHHVFITRNIIVQPSCHILMPNVNLEQSVHPRRRGDIDFFCAKSLAACFKLHNEFFPDTTV